MDLTAIIVALVALASAVVTAWMNYSTGKDLKKAQERKEGAEAAGKISDSAIDLVTKMEYRLDKVREECQNMTSKYEELEKKYDKLKEQYGELKEKYEELKWQMAEKDRRIGELETENGRLREEVAALKGRLGELENGKRNGGSDGTK